MRPSSHFFLNALKVAIFRRKAPLLVVVFLLILAATVSAAQDQPLPPPAPAVVRIYYDDVADLGALAPYDLFEVNNVQERYVLAAVSAAELAALRGMGWLVIPDRTAAAWRKQSGDLYYGGYRAVDEIYAELRQFAGRYPDLAQLVPYGHSYCRMQAGCRMPGGEETSGFELLALRITNERLPGASTIKDGLVSRGEKPLFFMLSGIHARELTVPEIAMRWIELLLDQYGRDADITWLVDYHELWVIPTANPDGHWLTELGTQPPYGDYPLMQRKNLDRDADGDGIVDCDFWPATRYSQFGVDLNRNHSFAWLPADARTSPCSLTYSGPSPASEPEIAALQSLLRALFDDWRGPGLDEAAPPETSGIFITLHNYSELVLRPWSFQDVPAPNEAGLQAIGDKLAAFNGYKSCRSPADDCLYAAHGTSDDWVYGELGVPAYTFEIGSAEQGFAPPYSVIDDEQWPLNRDAFLYAARIASRPYQLAGGPDITQLETAEIDPHGFLPIRFIVDESANGGQVVRGAEYSLDLPFWVEDAAPAFLAAPFAAQVVPFTLALDITHLAPGPHVFFVRGRDEGDQIGAARAVNFTVPTQPYPRRHFSFMPLFLGQ